MTCVRCDGTGWIEYTGGTVKTQRCEVEASPENPVYGRCKCKTPAEVHVEREKP